MIKKEMTERGFTYYAGSDRYNHPFSLQESSLASEAAIWFGMEAPDIQEKGWHPEFSERCRPYDLPDNVMAFSRMHLTQDQVKELLPLLEHFADTGELP